MQSHYAAADLATLGREWIAAWNSHDLERILALYAGCHSGARGARTRNLEILRGAQLRTIIRCFTSPRNDEISSRLLT
ncbi:nuclear transport factor 2 family protein [Bradyrhizobium sp. AZCC 1693]|uniref:nuclear transport factor 2 family protein n=1 Tax=Bradyrhizobium sp. AZCC 1693 TaxID=3117029 RepID=UPI002FEF3658